MPPQSTASRRRQLDKVSEGEQRVVAAPHSSSSLLYSGDENGREGHAFKSIVQRLMHNGGRAYFLRKMHEESWMRDHVQGEVSGRKTSRKPGQAPLTMSHCEHV